MKNSVYEKVIEAYPRIQNKITKTPLIHNEGLSELVVELLFCLKNSCFLDQKCFCLIISSDI